MSVLLKNGAIAADDYRLLADDEALPEGAAKVIVSLDRWRQDESLRARSDLEVGLKLPNTIDIETVWAEIKERPLLALDFPSFADGRAYSQARDLTVDFHYAGELRATGAAVVRDQLYGMLRCGFNSFQLRADQDPELCLRALRDFSLDYQPAAVTAINVLRQRRLARQQ